MAAGLGKLDWREHRVERLKALVSDGLSSRQIAAKLSHEWRATITRNQVVGAVHRNGLKLVLPVCTRLFGTRYERAKVRKIGSGARMKPYNPRPIKPPVPTPTTDPFIGITIIDLKPDSCRWPHGDPATPWLRYCGASAAESKPYCPYHCGLAYEPRAA